MIGTKISKSDFDGGLYAECAVWCNANNATIEDKGDYFSIVFRRTEGVSPREYRRAKGAVFL